MPRDLYINGPTMVKVKGSSALARRPFNDLEPEDDENAIYPTGVAQYHALGLSLGPIKIIPNFVHRDIYVDDFGSMDVPAEIMAMMADVQIHMTLVHFNSLVLDNCFSNSMGGIVSLKEDGSEAGTLAGAGVLLGAGKAVGEIGNKFISLNITSALEGGHWQFPAAYIAANPLEYPLGTERTAVTIRWRAIPYKSPIVLNSETNQYEMQEIKSRGAVLWTYTEDEFDPDSPLED